MAPASQRAACPKDKLEFKFFWAPRTWFNLKLVEKETAPPRSGQSLKFQFAGYLQLVVGEFYSKEVLLVLFSFCFLNDSSWGSLQGARQLRQMRIPVLHSVCVTQIVLFETRRLAFSTSLIMRCTNGPWETGTSMARMVVLCYSIASRKKLVIMSCVITAINWIALSPSATHLR